MVICYQNYLRNLYFFTLARIHILERPYNERYLSVKKFLTFSMAALCGYLGLKLGAHLQHIQYEYPVLLSFIGLGPANPLEPSGRYDTNIYDAPFVFFVFGFIGGLLVFGYLFDKVSKKVNKNSKRE